MGMIEFKNEPFTDFSLKENQQAFEKALQKVKAELGINYDLCIGGEYISTEHKNKSINPSDIDEVIGIISQADQKLAEKAIQTANETFHIWKKKTCCLSGAHSIESGCYFTPEKT